MEAEMYELIGDAIKILGPALITAFVAYKASMIQMQSKLKELDRGNQFKAREKLFDYHKSKLDTSEKAIESIEGSLGQMMGMAAANYGDNAAFKALIESQLKSNIENLPFQLRHVSRELSKYSSELPDEYQNLTKYLKEAENIKVAEGAERLTEQMVYLMKVYRFITHCLQLLIEREALSSFKPYLGNA